MFKNYNTVAEVKQAYKKYAFKLHPDKQGGNHNLFVEMQADYLNRLKELDGEINKGFDGKDHKYYYNQKVEQEVMNKITELLKLEAPDIDIELVGTWLWISGNTRKYKDILKSLKFRWNSKREKWSFVPPSSSFYR
ncbi:MAG: hypothetical protein Unbinned7913contig1002_48 [Prokaryotic dsDNA virus sp.]|jgi:curved DNA-binding protein CbpA|nr:molecular chaperone DnaJ [Parcubacteria group bacterium]QDP51293.1 MAG: hypothetical protein Unbinned7913contig1002_48 [Prokaryotic dsDNA virus sp.]|tara:strand:+ start:787 stop:1194 length:408 start_codon:yes stop_codon:yes gene_type:complete